MRTRSTFSINFWINTSRMPEGRAKIYSRITIDSKRVNLSLKYTINPEQWDSRLSMMKGKTADSTEINRYLQEVKSELFQCYRDLKLVHDYVSAEMVKARYFGEDVNHRNLTELFEYHNHYYENKLSKATLRHYRTTQKYLLGYIKYQFKKSDFRLRDLDHSFIVGFESYLRNLKPIHYRPKISNNGAMKHIQRLKKMVGIALDNQWVDKNPFQRFKVRMDKYDRGYLSQQELKRIVDFYTEIERLAIVKDLFVFSCYTGIAYCDLVELKEENIIMGIDGRYWISTKRLKTKNSFRLPLLEPALQIIEKYKKHPRREEGKLLPKLSNQKMNSYLKEIADGCKISKHLTFHMARHTFATTVMLSNGVPIETVSKVLGHTRLATTQIYARVLDNKISEDMEVLTEKIRHFEI